MFGVSFTELLLVMLVVLLVFGPDKLPEAAKTFGKFMRGVKKNSDSIRREFYNTVYTPMDDLKTEFRDSARNLIIDSRDSSPEETEVPIKEDEENKTTKDE